MLDLNKVVNFAVDIANDDSHGYSQYHRYGPDYDCSSLVTAALIAGGADIPKTLTTYTMLPYLLKIGYKPVSVGNVQAGDIFLSVKHHTVIAINDKQIVTATIDENGTIIGKRQGDQTGKEIYIRNFYTPSYGWDYHLRYIGSGEVVIKPKGDVCNVELKVLKKGIKDHQVKTLQTLLKGEGFKGSDKKVLAVDGSFGGNTDYAVRAFQKKNDLEVDGVVGVNTWNKILKG